MPYDNVTGQVVHLLIIGIRLIARTAINIMIPSVLVILLRIASFVLPSFFP
jgi:hypothetical protein